MSAPGTRFVKLAIRNPNDMAIGAMLFAIGVIGIVLCWHLPRGTAARMGPGFVPVTAAVALVVFGVFIAARGLMISGPALSRWAWRPLALVLGSVAVFVAAMPMLGFVAAIMATVLTAAAGSAQTRWGSALALAVGMGVGCAALFVWALGLPFPLWPMVR
jgi:putative tricarboxylic transport membrane protein